MQGFTPLPPHGGAKITAEAGSYSLLPTCLISDKPQPLQLMTCCPVFISLLHKSLHMLDLLSQPLLPVAVRRGCHIVVSGSFIKIVGQTRMPHVILTP